MLTEYQERFVDHFMMTGNKIESLRAAGYKGKGNPATMASQANKLYHVPKVQDEIQRRRDLAAQGEMIDVKQMLGRLTRMFMGELTSRTITSNGNVVENTISFRDQLEAGKLMLRILGMQEKINERGVEDEDIKLSKDLERLTKLLLARQEQVIAEVVNDED